MTDMTKAVPNDDGWLAPYNSIIHGMPIPRASINVSKFDTKGYLDIWDDAGSIVDIPFDQAKALIDALQRAVADYEERL